MWLEIQDRTVPVREYTKEVALAAGSENGIKTQSITPFGQVGAEGCSVHRIHREVIKRLRQVRGMEKPPNDKYKNESGMWYGTDKFDMGKQGLQSPTSLKS